jgi:sugar phosphate isomerase/epimerase
MDLGFLTVCLGEMSLREKAKWASKKGFKCLEVACWPRENTRDYSSSDIDVANLTQAEADEIKGYMKEYGLRISSLAYYDNNLHNDPERRAFINGHVKKCIDAASMLGTDMVGTFVGRNIDKSIEENFDEFEKVFGELVGYAEKKGIKIIIENCPMEGWQAAGVPGTISYTPELWDEMFKRVPSKNFGLNFDPSHLLFQLIDYYALVPKYIDRIFHVHAKDAEVFEDRLKWYGVFNKQLKGDKPYGYWRFRMPSLGQVDWKKFVGILKENGYDDVLSIEHEDPLYEGSDEKVLEGLSIGYDHLIDLM